VQLQHWQLRSHHTRQGNQKRHQWTWRSS